MNIIKLWLTQDWTTGPSPLVLRWNLSEKSGITRFYEVILRYINFDKNDPGHHDGQCKLTCNTNIFMFPMFKKFKSSKYYFALDWEEVYHTQHWEKGETLQSNMYNLHNIIKVSICLFVPYFEIWILYGREEVEKLEQETIDLFMLFDSSVNKTINILLFTDLDKLLMVTHSTLTFAHFNGKTGSHLVILSNLVQQ